jgi:protein-S-isoprenylcysteine O-methyltransferase Ste14
MPLMIAEICFTMFQVCWAVAWARLHLKIRKGREYAAARIHIDSNTRYKLLSPLLYLLQNTVSIACFWSNADILLKFHDRHLIRFAGVILMIGATWLYAVSLKHLGENYSPCYDAHLPRELVTSGPYRIVRHPMYLAKLMIGFGTILVSGSIWFVLPTIYLTFEALRSLFKEERYLAANLPDFLVYQSSTARIIPKVY